MPVHACGVCGHSLSGDFESCCKHMVNFYSDDFQVVVSGYQYIKMLIIFYYRYSLIFFFVLQLAYCSDLMKKIMCVGILEFPFKGVI